MTRLDRLVARWAATAAAALACVGTTLLALAQDVADTAEESAAQSVTDTADRGRLPLGLVVAQATVAEGADASSSSDAAPSPGTAVIGDLVWLIGSNGANVAWNQAQEYCDTLERAGFDDWRLPTLDELEAVHDPSAASGLRAPLEVGDCCAWSSTNLVEKPAEAKGALPDPTNDPRDYYWGFLFGSGDRYYSFRSFPDGLAMCVREP